MTQFFLVIDRKVFEMTEKNMSFWSECLKKQAEKQLYGKF